MAGNRVLLTDAFHAGARAKAAGRSWTACPYDVSSSNQTEARKVKAWLRGYRKG